MAGPLLLVPTAMERDVIVAASQERGRLRNWRIELCGFGVVAASAMTMRALTKSPPDTGSREPRSRAHERPSRVVLAGIAGSFDDTAVVGSAIWFSEVMCEGIGVGGDAGDDFVPAEQLGWKQVSLESGATGGNDFDGEIGDRLPLTLPAGQDGLSSDALLMTVCAASSTPAMAKRRVDRTRGLPVAEDMEGFAVAMACRLEGVPISIVRGISNVAGDRDHGRWQIDRALGAVADELARIAF